MAQGSPLLSGPLGSCLGRGSPAQPGPRDVDIPLLTKQLCQQAGLKAEDASED